MVLKFGNLIHVRCDVEDSSHGLKDTSLGHIRRQFAHVLLLKFLQWPPET